MSIFYEAILDFLNSLLPDLPAYENFYALNEVLAYMVVITAMWGFLLRPILKLFRLVK
jgi:hypothetical protein